MLHFYFLPKQRTTINISKLSSFRLMRLFHFTFLNIENDASTSQEVTGAYLSEEIWGKLSLYKILFEFPNMLLLLSFLSTFWPQPCNWESGGYKFQCNKENRCSWKSLSHSHEKTLIKGTIMQVNVIHALKPEK